MFNAHFLVMLLSTAADATWVFSEAPPALRRCYNYVVGLLVVELVGLLKRRVGLP